MEFIEYVTQDNDRWDLIAYKMYGDVNKMNILLENNPDHRLVTIFEAGVKLIVPIIEEESEKVALWDTD